MNKARTETCAMDYRSPPWMRSFTWSTPQLFISSPFPVAVYVCVCLPQSRLPRRPCVTVTAGACCLWAAHKKWSRQPHQLISGNGLRRELEWKSTCNLVGRQCVWMLHTLMRCEDGIRRCIEMWNQWGSCRRDNGRWRTLKESVSAWFAVLPYAGRACVRHAFVHRLYWHAACEVDLRIYI